jgi:hypothetical protein
MSCPLLSSFPVFFFYRTLYPHKHTAHKTYIPNTHTTIFVNRNELTYLFIFIHRKSCENEEEKTKKARGRVRTFLIFSLRESWGLFFVKEVWYNSKKKKEEKKTDVLGIEPASRPC